MTCQNCNESHIVNDDRGQPRHRICKVELAARLAMPRTDDAWTAHHRRRAIVVAARERELAALPRHVQGRTGADCAGCVAEARS